jgi:proline iminopeptidase
MEAVPMCLKSAVWCLIGLIAAVLPSSAQEARHEKVQRDGFDLYYRIWGSGPTVAILSGGPGFDCDYMLPVAVEVSKANQVILVELRGTGRSLPSAINADTVNLKTYIADLDAVRDQLKIKCWTLLGHSAGAMLAMHYAAIHRERVDRLVLVGSPPLVASLTAAQGDNARMRLLPDELRELANPSLSRTESIRIALPGSFFDRSKAAEMAAAFKPDSLHQEVMALMLKQLLPPDGDLSPDYSRIWRKVTATRFGAV